MIDYAFVLLSLSYSSSLVSGFDLSLLFDCRVLQTMVYCEAVRSAILATAWLLVPFNNVTRRSL